MYCWTSTFMESGSTPCIVLMFPYSEFLRVHIPIRLYIYYQGHAIFERGTPFDPVKYNKLYVPAQVWKFALCISEVLFWELELKCDIWHRIIPGKQCIHFPRGLGVVISGAIPVTDDMILAAGKHNLQQFSWIISLLYCIELLSLILYFFHWQSLDSWRTAWTGNFGAYWQRVHLPTLFHHQEDISQHCCTRADQAYDLGIVAAVVQVCWSSIEHENQVASMYNSIAVMLV
jgi:hypothetical protein